MHWVIYSLIQQMLIEHLAICQIFLLQWTNHTKVLPWWSLHFTAGDSQLLHAQMNTYKVRSWKKVKKG